MTHSKQIIRISLITGVFLTVFGASASAQFLTKSAAGKSELAEVVVADGFSKGLLYANQSKWFQALPAYGLKVLALSLDSLNGITSAEVETVVYAQAGVLRKISGSVTYTISVESKDGKYRYNFSSFLFHYYAQNRNYAMVKTGKTKPMEEGTAAGWQKLWIQHRKTISGLVTNQAEELQARMIEIPQPATAKSGEKKVEW